MHKSQLGWFNLPHWPVLQTPKTSKHWMSIFYGISPWVRLEDVEEKTRRRAEFWDENGRPHETCEQVLDQMMMMETTKARRKMPVRFNTPLHNICGTLYLTPNRFRVFLTHREKLIIYITCRVCIYRYYPHRVVSAF